MHKPYTRHDSLDLIRGIAILGILVVNIWAFSMPFAAYSNPMAFGDFEGWNRIVWQISAVVVQEKFITMFSILFGAGVALFVDHARAREDRVGARHYRRMAALLLIGMIHAYLIWSGDVLVLYAILGMVLYPFLKLSQRTILITLIVCLLLSILMFLGLGAALSMMPDDEKAKALSNWAPSAETLRSQVEQMRGSWLEQMPFRASLTAQMQSMMLFFFSVRLLAQMLIGVWLYRSGWLTGARSRTHYVVVALVALSVGLFMSYVSTQENLANQFTMDSVMGSAGLYNNIGSLIAAFGYMALFIAWTQSQRLTTLKQWLQNTGRMAFTSYLATSILCTLLFNGHGLGYFGQFDRVQQFFTVLAVWFILIGFAQVWLSRNAQGPLEKLWRWATYGRQA